MRFEEHQGNSDSCADFSGKCASEAEAETAAHLVPGSEQYCIAREDLRSVRDPADRMTLSLLGPATDSKPENYDSDKLSEAGLA